jgi:fructose-1,6-bisphosphatase/inositol monophosphatase family enzyme
MNFTARDLHALAAILREAAATHILPRFRRLRRSQIRTKSGPLDLVTDADEAAEAHITRACEHAFQGALIVGEEAAAANPALVARLADAPFAITLDPIDGTANFCAGLPLFGVMAAVVEHGETTAAIILDPITDSWSGALRGKGAHEYAPDGTTARLCVAAPVPLSEMTGMVSWRFMPPELRDRVLSNLPKVAQVWDHRCAAHEYRALIAGHSHFVMFNRLMPWDHLPGVLLHREAGGYAARFDAAPYRAGETTGGLICAADKDSWQGLADEFLEPRPAPCTQRRPGVRSNQADPMSEASSRTSLTMPRAAPR